MPIPWLQPFRDAATDPLILSLATVAADGKPDARSVVCRRIKLDGSLWFTSDARSAKHEQLVKNPNAAAVYWNPQTREQFRFRGGARLDAGSVASPDRLELWRELSPATRATFFWPAPGRPRVSDESAFAPSGDAETPPPVFEVIVFEPQEVEYLLLTVHPHQRLRWTLDRQWSVESLNP